MRLIQRNPVLNRVLRKAESGKLEATDPNQAASVKGSMWKCAFLCIVVILTAVLTVALVAGSIQSNIGDEAKIVEILTMLIIGIIVAAIAMLVISIAILFAPKAAHILGTIYCFLNGILLGAVTLVVDMYFPGVSFLALLGTCVVFLISLVVFRMLGSRVSSSFIRGVLIAALALVVVQLLGLLLSVLFPLSFGALFASFGVQMAISAFSVIIAAMVIIVNLNTMYRMEEYQIDKRFEWLAAYSMTVTLIWVYMEILEILVRILGRRR